MGMLDNKVAIITRAALGIGPLPRPFVWKTV